MTNEIRTSIKQVENGYVVTITYDGTVMGDYKNFTVIYSDVNEAFSFVKKLLDRTQIDFTKNENKGEL
jgi:hypothetical protein